MKRLAFIRSLIGLPAAAAIAQNMAVKEKQETVVYVNGKEFCRTDPDRWTVIHQLEDGTTYTTYHKCKDL